MEEEARASNGTCDFLSTICCSFLNFRFVVVLAFEVVGSVSGLGSVF